ncbi:hypothetical protein [Corynebacterium neomassiliense]|uniref:hypothetical protein n=1 Tax=Corynebacterium neomassiliense TaxID=2079482 RepID=UPI00192A5FD6|nr:hypothetical protein [Corynebacterium neomassiliense]
MTVHDAREEDTRTDRQDITRISSFTLSEDWLSVVVGLAVLLLALAGVITESWLIL